MARDEEIRLRTRADLAGVQQLQNAYNTLSRDEQKLVRDNLALAQSYARLQASQGNAAGGAQALRAQLSGLSAAPARNVLAVQSQIAGLDTSAAKAAQSSSLLGSAIGNTTAQVAQFGGALTLVSVARFSVEAGKAALSLRETENALRAVSGNVGTYENALATARRQQVLFGGSLQENIEGIQGLVITARDSGASLQQLVDLSQRLNVKSPEQGISGARVALSEAFSEGNITSLSRRFEIPKAAIEGLKDASIPAAEKIKILSDYLDRVGISSDAVAGKVDPTARTYRELGAAAENAKVLIGGFIADAVAPGATAVTNLLNVFQGGADGFTDFAVGATNLQRSLVGLPPLTAEAEAGFRNTGSAVLDFLGIQEQANTTILQSADAADRAAAASSGLAAATNTELNEKIEAQIQTDALTKLQAQLEADSIRAANGLLGSGDQALLLAQKYGIAQAAAVDLINAQQALGAAEALADQRKGEQTGTTLTAKQFDNFSKLRQKRDQEDRDVAKRQADEARRRAQQVRDSESALALARAKTPEQRVAVLQKELAATTDIVERNRILAQIEQARDSATKKARTARDPNARGLGALDKDTIALAGDERAQLAEVNRQLESGNLTTHQRNQLLIRQQELQEKITDEVLRQNEANVDAQLLTVRNEQQKIKEERELTSARNILAHPEQFSPEQRRLAELRVQEIGFEQEKRRLDIAAKEREAGGLTAINGQPIPQIGASSNVTPEGATTSATSAAPRGQAGIYLDGKQVGIVMFPQLLAMLASGGAQVAAAGG